MPKSIKHIFTKNNDQLPLAMLFAAVILFWAIFDSTMQYITPLLIEQQGFSNTMIGLIIGFSSVAGAIFDFFIYKIFKNANFRRMIMSMFAICFVYPLLLWETKSLWLFLFAMAVWGIYYDLYGFGAFNFVAKHIKRKNFASSFGIIQVFKSLGNIIAPLIIGFIIVDKVDWQHFAIGWLFLLVGFILFLYLLYVIRKKEPLESQELQPQHHRKLFVELRLWRKLGILLRPILIMTFYYHIIDAFFWTLIPLYVESINSRQFGGIFLAAYSLPALIAGWFVGYLANKYGKKKTAYVSLLIGSLILSGFLFVDDPILLIAIVFFASFFIKMTHPVMNSSVTDYVNDAPEVEVEIEGLEDFSTNIGYIIGPIAAGLLADLFGMQSAFGILGIVGVVIAVGLLLFAPKHIIIKTKPSEL